MLIIPAAPMDFKVHTSLAANTENWDEFVINCVNENFQLSLYKRIDSLEKTLSINYFPIAVLKTCEECKKLFQAIVDAIENSDKKVFRVKDYLDQNALQNALQNADLLTV